MPHNPSVPDQANLHHFVSQFYERVRQHPRLGPVFEEKLAHHWDEHIDRLTSFWVTVLSGVPSYKGNPFAVHQAIPDLSPALFQDWLALFEATTRDHLAPPLDALAREKAHRIAESLQQGLFFHP